MAEPLWRFDEVVRATAGRALGTGADALSGVTIDSREVRPGDLFVAIRGDRFDGHDFAAKALEAGAAAVLIDVEIPGLSGPAILVHDTLNALNQLAKAARERTEAKVIAITGSVGKTGTKDALQLALQASGPTHASVKSFNNHWGVPLSLARLPAEAPFAVFEIGMNHAGEITPLTKLVRPHVAIVTTVAPVHLGFFDSVDEIAEAKAEIFLGLEPDGTAVLNRDNAYFDMLTARARAAGAARIVTFGKDPDADVRLVDADYGEDGSQVTADILGRRIDYRLGAPGAHVALNSLPVLASVALVGGDLEAAAAELASLRPPPGRGDRKEVQMPGGAILVIDESYNANPASMAAALELTGQVPRARFARRIAVLGDMLELGADADRLHAELAGPIEAADIDLVFACGPHMERLFEALPAERRGAWAADSEALLDPVMAAVRPGDAVMIKGSLGSRMAPLVAALTASRGTTSLAEGSA